MKNEMFAAIRLTIISIIVFMVIYPLFIWGVAQLGPNKGRGEIVRIQGRVVGYRLEGQRFTSDAYFNDRPSSVSYNAAGSGGSNKGPSNPEYLKDVQNKIDTFMVHNPAIKKSQIPSELVTYSGSGLDPDLSKEALMIQVPRISAYRKVSAEAISQLIQQKTKKPLLGFLGPEKINVLELNIALDNLKIK